METVISRDGTRIAYDRSGRGPAVILVTGALCSRTSWSGSELAGPLADRFTVYNYDRRGRGDSGDTPPYAVDREIEDLAVLIDAAGGTASLYGHSSGAALALEAAVRLSGRVARIALYEAPYNDDPEARRAWRRYVSSLTSALAANRRGDAVALFMQYVGMTSDQIEGMRHAPAWPALEALAPTLAYDHTALLGEENSIPAELAGRVPVPALVMYGGASFPFMAETAQALSRAIPCARLRMLVGQTHAVSSEALAPALLDFFAEGA